MSALIDEIVKDYAGNMKKIQKKYNSERTERYEDSSHLRKWRDLSAFWKNLLDEEKTHLLSGVVLRIYKKDSYIYGMTDVCLGMIYVALCQLLAWLQEYHWMYIVSQIKLINRVEKA